jgi:hypothetical protein
MSKSVIFAPRRADFVKAATSRLKDVAADVATEFGAVTTVVTTREDSTSEVVILEVTRSLNGQNPCKRP